MENKPVQEESSALMAQVRASAVRDGTTAPPPDPEVYNFTRAGQISTEQMRAITTVNDLFARNLTHTLGAWLRTEFQVNVTTADQKNFDECLGSTAELSFLCTVRMEPLGATGIMEVDLLLALPVVDLLLGGTGKAGDARALTDVEELILGSVVKLVMRELNTAWYAVGLQFHMEKRLTLSQSSRVMSPGERTLALEFDARMPEAAGNLRLYLPAVVLSNMLRRLIEDRDRPRRRPDDIRRRVRELVSHARLQAVLQTPAVRLRASEISRLEPGSILRVAVQKHVPAELRIAGLLYGRARPVRVGEHRGARMEVQSGQDKQEAED